MYICTSISWWEVLMRVSCTITYYSSVTVHYFVIFVYSTQFQSHYLKLLHRVYSIRYTSIFEVK
jgi:hypothetical protein